MGHDELTHLVAHEAAGVGFQLGVGHKNVDLIEGADRRQADDPPLRVVGWNEITVVIRFWIIAGLCVAFALGIFYAEWNV